MAEVRLEIELAHPPERVWRALTDARVLGEWFMRTDLEPTEGAQFTLDPGTLPGFLGTISAEISELVAPRRLVMLWQGEKLHTKVSWELASHEPGCLLQVVQTGFIGAPAAIRQRSLRATYTELFEQRLPATLDRLAAGALDWGEEAATAAAAEPGEPAVRAAAPGVPKQRRPAINVALAAWSAGRQIAVAGGEPAPDPGGPGAGASAATPERSPGVGNQPPAPRPPVDDAPAGADPADTEPSWPRRLTGLPSWVRAVTVAGAAAVLVLLVLAVAMWTGGPGPGLGGGTDGEEDRRGPGAAQQPGNVGEATEPPVGGSGGAPPGGLPGESAGPATGGAGVPGNQPGAGPGGGTPSGGPPSETPGTRPTGQPGPPELTASYTTSGGVLGVGSRSVAVTVSNPGPGDATGWEVTMDVGDQDVSNVSGASHRQDGSLVIFTAAAPGPAAGASTTFSYEVGGLLGADDPSSCTIDGRPCD